MSIPSSNVTVRHCPIFPRETNATSPTATSSNGKGPADTGSGVNRFGKVIGGWTSSRFSPLNSFPLYSPPLTSLTLPPAVFQTEKVPPLQLPKSHQQLQDDDDSDLISPRIASPATTKRTPSSQGSGDWDLTLLSSPLRFLRRRRSSNSSSISSLSYSDDSREDSISTPRTPVAQSTDRSASTARYDQIIDSSATHDPLCCDREDGDIDENCKGALSPPGPRFLATPEQFKCLVDGLDNFHLPPAAVNVLSLPASTFPGMCSPPPRTSSIVSVADEFDSDDEITDIILSSASRNLACNSA